MTTLVKQRLIDEIQNRTNTIDLVQLFELWQQIKCWLLKLKSANYDGAKYKSDSSRVGRRFAATQHFPKSCLSFNPFNPVNK